MMGGGFANSSMDYFDGLLIGILFLSLVIGGVIIFSIWYTSKKQRENEYFSPLSDQALKDELAKRKRSKDLEAEVEALKKEIAEKKSQADHWSDF